MTENNTPRNIFEVINANIVAMSEDMNTMHAKIDKIYNALYPTDEGPNQPTESGNDSASLSE